ncbi:ATP-dependent DNA helicase [Caerostris darwini]|uniref:ATP-dependent DNA helicase n=1 Tax=Caerostris darwini TaxID=1538125 RepID=A0AAV4X2H0_9ARAC|nr:ATP-dependent DNA helicase [Caerostris darwini]
MWSQPSAAIHKSQGATFKETAVGFNKGLTRGLLYVALSRVISAAGLYILDNYSPTSSPHEDDPILQELKRLRERSIVKKFKFLLKHCDPNTLQIMYHNDATT